VVAEPDWLVQMLSCSQASAFKIDCQLHWSTRKTYDVIVCTEVVENNRVSRCVC
jgi:hypothetical protein